MKRSILLLSLLALAVACQREEFDYPPAPDPLPQATRLHLEAGKPDPEGEATKTYWTGSTIEWSAGDAIQLGFTANGSWGPVLYPSEELGAAAATAHFEVDAVQSGSAPYRFYTVYPSAAASSYSAGSHTVALTLPAAQAPVRNGGILSFDPAADLLYGVSRDSYDSWPDVGSIPINWSRLVALGNVTLKNLPASFATETVQKVTLTFQRGTAIAGSFTLDLEDGSLNPDDAGNVITLDGKNLAVTDGKLELWFTMAPATVSSLGVIVETDKAFYSRAVGGISKEFLQNARNILGVSMSGAVRTEKAYHLVTEAPADWSGEYLIGYGENFFDGKGSGNYATNTTLTVTGNAVSYADGNSHKVVVAKTDNGYSIKYGSSYVGYDWTADSGNNYLTFNTSYSADRDDWTFSVDAGQTMITSVKNPARRLQWNSGDTRFAGYKTTMKDVSLYRLGGTTGAGVPSFTLLKDQLDMAYSGGAHAETGVYSLVNGADADIRLFYDDTVFSGISASGGTLSFTMTANESPDVREETIVLLYADEMQLVTVRQAGHPQQYVQVTASLDDWSGEYLIGAGSNFFAGKASGNYADYQALTVSDGVVSYSDGSSLAVTISSSTNGYTLQFDDKFIGYYGSGNYLGFSDTVASDDYEWTIAFEEGVAKIRNYGHDSYYIKWNNNSGQERFSAYASAMTNIVLYRLSGSGSGSGGSGGSGGGSGESANGGVGYLDCYEVPKLTTLNGSSTSGTNSDRDDIWYRYYTSSASRQVATHTFTHPSTSRKTRNYTVLFDETKYAPVWTAHAMHKALWPDNDAGRNDSWTDDPAIDLTQQGGLTNAGTVGYSRGHLVASNYRQSSVKQNKQTFYHSNQAPQWQNSFNSGVWSNLEEDVAKNAPAVGSRDTLYIVTGVLYEESWYSANPSKPRTLKSGSLNVPIPTHFYKCIMKCSFRGDGTMSAASGIAFLMSNEAHTGGIKYYDASFVTTIDAVESRAGFDFFPNVPTDLQNAAEATATALWSY